QRSAVTRSAAVACGFSPDRSSANEAAAAAYRPRQYSDCAYGAGAFAPQTFGGSADGSLAHGMWAQPQVSTATDAPISRRTTCLTTARLPRDQLGRLREWCAGVVLGDVWAARCQRVNPASDCGEWQELTTWQGFVTRGGRGRSRSCWSARAPSTMPASAAQPARLEAARVRAAL